MSDNNRYSGAITIDPPLTASEIRSAPTSVLEDCRLRVIETGTPTADGEAVIRTADAIEPTCDGFSGRNLVPDLQLLVSHIGLLSPVRTLGGHIEVHWANGYRAAPTRYAVRDGWVVTVEAQFAWPGVEHPGVLAELEHAQASLARVHDALAQLRALGPYESERGLDAWSIELHAGGAGDLAIEIVNGRSTDRAAYDVAKARQDAAIRWLRHEGYEPIDERSR